MKEDGPQKVTGTKRTNQWLSWWEERIMRPGRQCIDSEF